MLSNHISIYIPEDVRLILWAPNFGTVGFARPLPADKGLALVIGGGAAMAPHKSSSSDFEAPELKAIDVVFGGGAAMEPHKSSSSSLDFRAVLLDGKFDAEKI